ncbi:hypothetical protein LX36DRAFT_443766 [Colletotrichum falcatum]|nr:hypothetical protein LX36DRAFT_443766 [Colletotrichum falcatum]
MNFSLPSEIGRTGGYGKLNSLASAHEAAWLLPPALPLFCRPLLITGCRRSRIGDAMPTPCTISCIRTLSAVDGVCPFFPCRPFRPVTSERLCHSITFELGGRAGDIFVAAECDLLFDPGTVLIKTRSLQHCCSLGDAYCMRRPAVIAILQGPCPWSGRDGGRSSFGIGSTDCCPCSPPRNIPLATSPARAWTKQPRNRQVRIRYLP